MIVTETGRRARQLVGALVVALVAGIPGGVPSAGDAAAIIARNPDGNYIVLGVLGDVVYRRVDGVEVSLDAYLQKEGTRRPAVIVVHGGGGTSGSRIARVGQLLEMLTPAGFSWFSIDYRLAPEHPFPAALDDLRAALHFVRAHAAELRIDPDRVAVLGEDFGAQLAALLAAERPPGLRAVVSLGGIYELISGWISLEFRIINKCSGKVRIGILDNAYSDRSRVIIRKN